MNENLHRTKHKTYFQFLFVFLIYLLIEGLCYLSILIAEKRFDLPFDPNPTSLSEKQKSSIKKLLKHYKGKKAGFDPVLGWVNISETNAAGMRDNHEYDTVPPSGVLRISAFGDSFTYGSDVAIGDTWEKQLMVINPSIEVLNYGVPAYGLDQEYLRYLQVGAEYNPHIVFIGYMSENIARNVNVFRAFYTSWYRNVIFTKPRFKLRNEELVLLENPLPNLEEYDRFLHNDIVVLAKLGQNDYHYQINYNKGKFDFLPSVRFAKVFWYSLNKKIVNPIFKLNGMYSTESEAYKVTEKIFDSFYKKVLENGALPIILIFPDINDQRRCRDKKERRYTPLLNNFRSKGYRYIDTLVALEQYKSDYTANDLTVKWGHFSPLGNKIISKYIFTYLKNRKLTSITELKKEVEEDRIRLGIEFRKSTIPN